MPYDTPTVYTLTATENGSSNNIINSTTNKTGVLIHKVVLRQTTNGSNAVSVLINDDVATGTTNQVIALFTSSYGGAAGDAYARYVSETFDPPVPMQRGVSFTLAGTNVSATIYYTRR